jgi:hypothetical protein
MDQNSTSTTITFDVTEEDPADELTASIVTPPTHGKLGEVDQTTGTITYTPTSGYSGTDSFAYKVTDGIDDSNVATISITVPEPPVPENHPPVAKDQVIHIGQNTTFKSISFNVTEVDKRDELSAIIVSHPLHGNLSQLNQEKGTVMYIPNSDYFGNDSFTYKVNDGIVDSNIANITVQDSSSHVPSNVAVAVTNTQECGTDMHYSIHWLNCKPNKCPDDYHLDDYTEKCMLNGSIGFELSTEELRKNELCSLNGVKGIEDKLNELGGINSNGIPQSEPRQSHLENSFKDIDHCVQDYVSGTIYWSEKTGAYLVKNPILAKYKELGGESGELGFPRSDEFNIPKFSKVSCQIFGIKEICGPSNDYFGNAYILRDDIFTAYQPIADILQFPESDTTDLIFNYQGKQIHGVVSHFMKQPFTVINNIYPGFPGPYRVDEGSIYVSDHGLHITKGVINGIYEGIGGFSCLGFPITEEEPLFGSEAYAKYNTPKDSLVQSFNNGFISRSPTGGSTYSLNTVPPDCKLTWPKELIGPEPKLPEIKSFKIQGIEHLRINAGQSITLTWDVINCDASCSISIKTKIPGIQDEKIWRPNLESHGSITDKPSSGTFYFLEVYQDGKFVAKKQVDVFVFNQVKTSLFYFNLTNPTVFYKPCVIAQVESTDAELAKTRLQQEYSGYNIQKSDENEYNNYYGKVGLKCTTITRAFY